MTPVPSKMFRLRAETRLKNARLVELRERLGLTQAAFAERFGIDKSTYCGYETMRLYPSPKHAELLSDLAGCEPAELFPETLREIAERGLPRAIVVTGEAASERLLTAVPQQRPMLPAMTAETPEGLLADAERMAFLNGKIATLDGRKSHFVRRYFGLDGQPSETLEQIGARYGIGGEQVRKVLRQALWTLNKAMVREGLVPEGHEEPLTMRRRKTVNVAALRWQAMDATRHGCPPEAFRPLYRLNGRLVPRPDDAPRSGVFDGIFCAACGKQLRIHGKHPVHRIDFRKLHRRGSRAVARGLLGRITPKEDAPKAFYDVEAFEDALRRLVAEAEAALEDGTTDP